MRESSLAAYEAMENVSHVETQDGVYGPPRSDEFCMERSGQVLPVATAGLTVKSAHPLCTLGFNPVVAAEPATEQIAA
jgi:hypothetical protein